MLLSFSCKNFRSFKHEATLSMLPVNAYKELPDNLASVQPLGTNASGVLLGAAVYGANASGKTNLFRAVDYARGMVVGSFTPGDDVPLQPFVGCPDPTEFSFDVYVDSVRYRYAFSCDTRGVVEEELHARPRGERLVFSRVRQDDGGYLIKQGSSYPGIASRLKGLSDNCLVLSLLARYGVEPCVKVFAWFKDKLVISNRAAELDYSATLQRLKSLGEQNFTTVMKVVQSADLGIAGARLSESELTEEEVEAQRQQVDRLKAVYEALTGEQFGDLPPASKKLTFQFLHRIDGNEVGFGFDDESLGTVTMLSLAADLVDAISNGKTLFVDEIENSIHPVLLGKLISLVFSNESNSAHAQLVFTTHDLSLLGANMLRRDQIWFVEKEAASGSSELYPLSAFSPKKADSIMNRYLYGAYGAVPFIGGELIND